MNIKKLMTLCCLFVAAVFPEMAAKPAFALEKTQYNVIEKQENFELREYPSFVVAETYMEGDFETVGNGGFRRLAAYIGGENVKNQSISMTSPVTQEAQSEKIAMTAPVTQEKKGNLWRITFMMPSKYTMDGLPRPNDDRVNLTLEPPKLVAAVRYSGTWARERYEENEAKLLSWINVNGWKVTGQAIWARYDPPFMPWFLRRNEIMLPVEIE